MPTLHVVKPFNLLLNPEEQKAIGAAGPMVRFGVGHHDDVHDLIAEHPYAQLHLGDENAAATSATPVSGNPLAVELDAAVRRAEGAEKALDDERAAHAETRAQLAEAHEITASAGEAASSDDDASDDDHAEISIRHKGRGLFAVYRGEEQITEPMPKVEANQRKAEILAAGEP